VVKFEALWLGRFSLPRTKSLNQFVDKALRLWYLFIRLTPHHKLGLRLIKYCDTLGEWRCSLSVAKSVHSWNYDPLIDYID